VGVEMNHLDGNKNVPIERRNRVLHFCTIEICFGSYYKD